MKVHVYAFEFFYKSDLCIHFFNLFSQVLQDILQKHLKNTFILFHSLIIEITFCDKKGAEHQITLYMNISRNNLYKLSYYNNFIYLNALLCYCSKEPLSSAHKTEIKLHGMHGKSGEKSQ